MEYASPTPQFLKQKQNVKCQCWLKKNTMCRDDKICIRWVVSSLLVLVFGDFFFNVFPLWPLIALCLFSSVSWALLFLFWVEQVSAHSVLYENRRKPVRVSLKSMLMHHELLFSKRNSILILRLVVNVSNLNCRLPLFILLCWLVSLTITNGTFFLISVNACGLYVCTCHHSCW